VQAGWSKRNTASFHRWLAANDSTFSSLTQLLHTYFPVAFRLQTERCSSLIEEGFVVPYPFTTLTWNDIFAQRSLTGSPHVHMDNHPMCPQLVVVCGNFTGGGIFFPHLNLKLPLKPGDVLAFNADKVLHCATPYNGERVCIGLFCCRHIFMPNCKSTSEL
jgi:hypothetical protein